MRTQLQTVSLRIQTVRSNDSMMQSMKGASSVLKVMNRSQKFPELARIAEEFERENDKMEQQNEIADGLFEDATEAEEGDEIVDKVLDEIGVDLASRASHTRSILRLFLHGSKSLLIVEIQLGDTPSGIQKEAAPEKRVAQAEGGVGGAGGGNATDDALMGRFDALKRDP